MGVVFFLSLPFMGVMLFPSFRLGNVPREGGASLALLSLFFILLLPSLFFLSSSFFSLSSSLFSHFSFLPHKLFPSIFLLLLFSTYFHLAFFSFILSFSFVFCFLLLLFFFFKGTACTVCFQDVGDDATDCNPVVIQL